MWKWHREQDLHSLKVRLCRCLAATMKKRRARDSNPQLLTEHLISNELPNGENPEENDAFENSAAVGAAVGRENTAIDPDLAAIIERWTDLPEPLKSGILAMVRAAGDACTK